MIIMSFNLIHNLSIEKLRIIKNNNYLIIYNNKKI